jgi:tRNA pseudouridine13 synthase
MASSNSQDVVAEPPRKRQKLSPPPSTTTTKHVADEQTVEAMNEPETQMQIVVSDNGFQPEREQAVGILHFVNATNPGFSGTLKQRYVF